MPTSLLDVNPFSLLVTEKWLSAASCPQLWPAFTWKSVVLREFFSLSMPPTISQALFSATFIPVWTVVPCFIRKMAASRFRQRCTPTHCLFRAKKWRARYLGRGPRDHLAFYPLTAVQTQMPFMQVPEPCLFVLHNCYTPYLSTVILGPDGSPAAAAAAAWPVSVSLRLVTICPLSVTQSGEEKHFSHSLIIQLSIPGLNSPNKRVTFTPHWHISSTHPQSGNHIN